MIFVLIFPCSLYALDWNKEKYVLPENDPNWLSQIQRGSKEFYQISHGSKLRVLERILKEKKEELKEVVQRAETYILNQSNYMISEKYLKKWHHAFISAQHSWLKQLELEGEDYFFQEGSLGGNSSDDWRLSFMIKMLEQRIENIKGRWWFKEQEKVFLSKQ